MRPLSNDISHPANPLHQTDIQPLTDIADIHPSGLLESRKTSTVSLSILKKKRKSTENFNPLESGNE